MRINLDSPILRALTRMFDTIVVTLLFVIGCVPIFSIGASCVAMQSTMIAIVSDTCSGVTRHFFGAFRENFKQATALWLLDALVGLVVVGDILVCWGFEMDATVILAVMQGLTVFCTALYLSVSIYLFAGIAIYRVTWKQAITNALIWTMGKLPYTLCLLVIYAAMFAAVLLAWFLAFPAVALGLYLQAKLLHRVFGLPDHSAPPQDEEIDYG